MPIAIYVVEDHPVFQYALSAYINKVSDLTVCGMASSGQEALTQISKVQPDIVLVDISLPDISGIEVVAKLHLWDAELRMLMLTSHTEDTHVRQALKVGARGFIVKGDPAEIEPAIRAVLRGEIYLSPQLRAL